jgi:hypothetical protein
LAGFEDRRSSRNTALVAAGVSVCLALVTTSATTGWFGLGVAEIMFAVSAVASFRARAWSMFTIAVAVFVYTPLLFILVLMLSGTTWAPSLG